MNKRQMILDLLNKSDSELEKWEALRDAYRAAELAQQIGISNAYKLVNDPDWPVTDPLRQAVLARERGSLGVTCAPLVIAAVLVVTLICGWITAWVTDVLGRFVP